MKGKQKENKVYDTAFFQKLGSIGGIKLSKTKNKSFYKENGKKGAASRWGNKLQTKNK